MKHTRKIMGLLKITLSLLWMGVAVLLLVYGLKGIQQVDTWMNLTLETVDENVELVKVVMNEITDVLVEVDLSLSTVETSMIDGGLVLLESRPMVDKTSQLISEDVPQTMEDIEDSLPAVIETAKTIEQTLTLLSRFKIVLPNPFGTDFQFDLGVDYDPEVSLEESLTNLGTSLAQIPGQLRLMEGDFISTDISLSVMSENLLNVAHDLDGIRGELRDINPAIQAMVDDLEGIQNSLMATQSGLPVTLKTARFVLIILVVLLLLTQVPAMYGGLMLLGNHVDGKDGDGQ